MIIHEPDIKSLLPERKINSHKGDFGKVMVFAGSEEYPGAAWLCAKAVLKTGAGLVTLASGEYVCAQTLKNLPEATFLPLKQKDGVFNPETETQLVGALSSYNVLVLGPGLGGKEGNRLLIQRLLTETGRMKNNLQVVIDADGLNALGRLSAPLPLLASRLVLTPHPGEMSRLTGMDVSLIQSDRTGTAAGYARIWQSVVVLKGAETVIASPDGRIAVNPSSNPVLSTPGTGDVLSGMIASLIAQGLDGFEAATAGVFIHSASGEVMSSKIGDRGMLASELLPEIPYIIKKILTK